MSGIPGLDETSSLPGYEDLLRSITAAAREAFRAAACSVATLDADEASLVFQVATGAGAEQVVGMRLPVGSGIAGWVMLSGEAIVIENVRSDPRFARDAAASTGYLPQSIMAVPLEADDRTYGVMEVLDRGRGDVTGRPGLEMLGLFARQAVIAMQMHDAFRDLRRGPRPAALEAGAAVAPQPRDDTSDLARALAAVNRLGEAERSAATALIDAFLGYVGRQRGPSGLV